MTPDANFENCCRPNRPFIVVNSGFARKGTLCGLSTTLATPGVEQHWLERRVLGFFRFWHMIFLCSGGVLAVIILLCCCFKCRIPRTKQEIESDFRRKKVTRKFRRELDTMEMEEIDVKDMNGVLDKVKEKFSVRADRRGSLFAEGASSFRARLARLCRRKKVRTSTPDPEATTVTDDDLKPPVEADEVGEDIASKS